MKQNKSVEEVVDRWEAQGHISPQHSKEVIIQDLTKLLQTSQEREREIVEAWRNEGPRPDFHREMKAKLYREWPTLAVAVERLTNPNKD